MHTKKILILLFILSAILVATVEAQLNAGEKQEILAAQNRYRAEVNVTALNWSENLSQQAQECADYNAANFLPQGRQKHCPKSGFGQNIALATSSLHRNLTQKVDQWGDEKRNFINGEYPSVSATGSPGAVSHYTQMIWQETTEVGCGKANSSGYEILVCDYSPRGNINGTAVYAPPQPKPIEVGSTKQYKTLTNSFAKMPKRSIIINTIFNRPVSCYSTSPV
ncbi:MAG: CAP domain-containing protein [Methanothrix sp.]|nr:CAP domain-containing protein [Methanothrix sp.]